MKHFYVCKLHAKILYIEETFVATTLKSVVVAEKLALISAGTGELAKVILTYKLFPLGTPKKTSGLSSRLSGWPVGWTAA
jgi:hypothetical protein